MTLEILKKLIAYPTVTPLEHGIYAYIRSLFPSFTQIIMEKNGVKNLFLYQIPKHMEEKEAFESLPHFCFAGHIDVVPPGCGALTPKNIDDLESNNSKGEWLYPPFLPTLQDNFLYGRGAQDMKGGVACFLSALQDFVKIMSKEGDFAKQDINAEALHSYDYDSNKQNLAEHVSPCILSILLTSDEEGDGIYGTQYVLSKLKDMGMLPTHALSLIHI